MTPVPVDPKSVLSLPMYSTIAPSSVVSNAYSVVFVTWTSSEPLSAKPPPTLRSRSDITPTMPMSLPRARPRAGWRLAGLRRDSEAARRMTSSRSSSPGGMVRFGTVATSPWAGWMDRQMASTTLPDESCADWQDKTGAPVFRAQGLHARSRGPLGGGDRRAARHAGRSGSYLAMERPPRPTAWVWPVAASDTPAGGSNWSGQSASAVEWSQGPIGAFWPRNVHRS